MAQPESYPISSVSNESDYHRQSFPPMTSQPVGYPKGLYPACPGAVNPDLAAPPSHQQSLSAQDPIILAYLQPNIEQPTTLYLDASLSPGLEYLKMVDQLIVKQKIELPEILTGFETNNKYAVTDNMGQQMYYAMEKNDFCYRSCLGPIRAFDMIILDNDQIEIMKFHRPLRCISCCCPCWLQEMLVTSRDGQVLGSIEQNWSLCIPKFSVKNGAGKTILHIRGPIRTGSCCGTADVEFDVLSLDKQHKIGMIAKKWSGMLRKMFTDADTFGVTFPVDLDVNAKATLLAATFLIDFMFFELKRKKDRLYFIT